MTVVYVIEFDLSLIHLIEVNFLSDISKKVSFVSDFNKNDELSL